MENLTAVNFVDLNDKPVLNKWGISMKFFGWLTLVLAFGEILMGCAVKKTIGIVDVVKDPQAYDGKKVSTAGVFSITSGGLFLNRDFDGYHSGDYRIILKIDRRGIGSDSVIPAPSDVIAELHGKCVFMSGYIDSSSSGLVGGYTVLRGVDLNAAHEQLNRSAEACSVK